MSTEQIGNLSRVVILLLLLYIIFIKPQKSDSIDISKINTSFELTRQRDSSLIATQLQNNNLTQSQALNAGLLKMEDYMKNIQSQVRVGISTKIQDRLVPYSVPVEKIVYVDSSTNDTSIYIKVPLPVEWSDSFNFFSGKVTVDGFDLDSMGSIVNLRITVFDKKQGFLKKRIPVVEVKTDNKNTTITGLNNVVIKTKTPFYKKVLVVFTAGVSTAVIAYEKLFK